MTNQTQIATLASPAARPPVGMTPVLTRRQKAAIVVQFILNEGAEVALTTLPDDLQATLTQQLGDMHYVHTDTLNEVLTEFADELGGVGLSFPKGIAGALSALDGKISAQTAQRLRKEAGVRQAGDPWARIARLSADELRRMLEAESTEVAAVALSKIDVTRAAEVLGKLPGAQARLIAYAVSQTGAVTPDAVDRIGLSLASQLDNKPERAFNAAPENRVGAILNVSPSLTRDDVLSGLDETDSVFAQAVRKAIFTFSDIPTRIAALDVPRILRDADGDAMVTALAFAATTGQDEARDHMLENLGKRMSEQIREQIEERGTPKRKDGEAAMNTVVAGILSLVEAGEITLVQPDEEE